MNEIEQKIQDVKDYFKNKILSGDFSFKINSKYTIEIIIDDKYSFIIWIGNLDIPETRKIHDSGISFINIDFTNEESRELDFLIKKIISK